MKRWIAVVTASIALVGLWALPPSALDMPTRMRLAESIRADALNAELGRVHGALRLRRWSDSLSALVVAAPAVGGMMLSPPAGEALDAQAVREWEERQRAELSSLPKRDQGMTVGLFWQPVDQSAIAGLPSAVRGRAITFVGEREGASYCVRALPYVDGSDARRLREPFQLGPCRLYATYGLPGERVAAWLKATALGFARVPIPGYAAELARAVQQPPDAPRLFGYYRPRYSTEGVVVQACLAGRAADCERALITPPSSAETRLAASSPAVGVQSYSTGAPFGPLDDGLLFDLEARFGPEAFARFWTSSAPVPEAFEEAFGVSLGDWVLDWVGEHVELYRAGPSLPASSLGWSVLLLALFGAGASTAGMRRRVG